MEQLLKKTYDFLNTDKKRTIILFILYKFFLEIIYVNTIAKTFGYVGYTFSTSLSRYIVVFALFIITLVILPKKEGSISSIFNLVLFLMTMVPVMIVFEYGTMPYWMLLGLVTAFWAQCAVINLNIKFPKIPKLKLSNKKTLRACFGALVLFFVAFVFSNPMPDLSKISFSQIHLIRAEFAYSSVVWAIAVEMFCKILNPLMIAISVKEKNYARIIISVLMQGYIYTVTGFKTFLFIIPVVLFVVLISDKNYFKNILRGFTYGTFGAYLVYLFTQMIYIPALIHNRVLFFPAQIKYSYLDFFARNEFVNFSQSTIGGVFNISNVYEKTVPNIIGQVYFDKEAMHANTGYLADGYANLGILGMFLVAIVLGLILNYLNYTCERHSMKYVLAVIILFAVSLNDGALMTSLFSGGLGFAILLFTFIDFDIEKGSGDKVGS